MHLTRRLGGVAAVIVGTLALTSGSALAANLSEQGQGVETNPGTPGCQFTSAGCTVSSGGTITGTPIQQGTYTSTLTIDYASASSNGQGGFCAPASGTATLFGPNGSITKNESGTVCEVGPTGNNVEHTFNGTYTITGGTGAYAGASGSGSVTSDQAAGDPLVAPITSSEVGSIDTANEKPGKGCGDKNHVHQRQDECK
jgi:hypothetical protein